MYMYTQFVISIFALKAASKNDFLTIAYLSREERQLKLYFTKSPKHLLIFKKKKKYLHYVFSSSPTFLCRPYPFKKIAVNEHAR